MVERADYAAIRDRIVGLARAHGLRRARLVEALERGLAPLFGEDWLED